MAEPADPAGELTLLLDDDVVHNRNLNGDIGSDGSTPQDRAAAAGFRGTVSQTVVIDPALAISGNEILNKSYYHLAYLAMMRTAPDGLHLLRRRCAFRDHATDDSIGVLLERELCQVGAGAFQRALARALFRSARTRRKRRRCRSVLDDHPSPERRIRRPPLTRGYLAACPASTGNVIPVMYRPVWPQR